MAGFETLGARRNVTLVICTVARQEQQRNSEISSAFPHWQCFALAAFLGLIINRMVTKG
jgi:hypothetical protein